MFYKAFDGNVKINVGIGPESWLLLRFLVNEDLLDFRIQKKFFFKWNELFYIFWRLLKPPNSVGMVPFNTLLFKYLCFLKKNQRKTEM